jgi:hypothetical protein
MIAMLNLAGLVLASIFAAAIAAACNWLLLQVTFRLMQPAAVRKSTTQTHLARHSV